MFARAHTGTIIGIDAREVIAESHRANGIPGLTLVGLARGAVREAIVRVRSAIVSTGIKLGSHRLVVSLWPAELEKQTSGLDLPLAMSLLASGGVLPAEALQGRRFFGELSLSGTLEPVRGVALLADLARRCGDQELIVPYDNAEEAAVIPNIRVVGARTLDDVVEHLRGNRPLPGAKAAVPRATTAFGCLSEVRGQTRAKRAIEIAAAGAHNILLIGPPGSGKTMLARRMPTLLPELDPEASIEVTRIHSAAGALGERALILAPPFRAPHHTASEAALCGGGSVPRPGEVTLAHRGVLFLDELPEFSRRALESLREPLEEGEIHIARAALSLSFPARMLLVAAMNPCPCGRFKDGVPAANAAPDTCVCGFDTIQRYRGRLSGPLLDRIDLHVLVDALPYRDYAKSEPGESSAVVRKRILAARARQTARLGPGRLNSHMGDRDLRRQVPLATEHLSLIETAIEAHGLSTRAINRVLRTARTIADLGQSDVVRAEHLEEALSLRVLDRDAFVALHAA